MSAAPPRTPRLREVLSTPKMLAILVLGAASGFPNQITESALQAWLKDGGATNTTIGIMSYVALPYLLKPLWAPFIDRFPLPFLGRRRGWMLVTQVALAAAIALFALQNPHVSLLPVTACAHLPSCSFPPPRTSPSTPTAPMSRLPASAGRRPLPPNLGYRLAAWLAFAIALVLADHLGWRLAFLSLAGIMLLFCIATVRAPSSYNSYRPSSLSESVIEPLKELLGTPSAAALLLVVLLFKAGDAFSNRFFTVFMLDVGFSKTEIALIVKGLFVSSTLVGVVLGGALMVRLGLLRSMLAFGVLQALSNLLYCLLAVSGKSYPIMVAAVVIEHIAGAMGGIALVALIMALCDVRYSAFQFALLSALALLPALHPRGSGRLDRRPPGLVRLFHRQLHPRIARTDDRVAEAPADRGARSPRRARMSQARLCQAPAN